ncbi:MAG: YiiX/YebB-like N1pC/P60 family cysteine hydrolase [Bacteroidales bacterium]|nr:YiiX/YebB-like N1pC/P60 family cysteine hydrolase [Bacteroidales bacterium]
MLTKIYNGFVKVLGDIKVFPYPLFVIYDPGSYRVKGDEIREVMQVVEPGDILVRGYVNYLDGYLIPGFFSHAGLYLGRVDEDDKRWVKPQAMHLFRSGSQMVIHAMAEGVFMEDIINFCRCDFMMILRRNPSIESEAARQITSRTIFENALQRLGLPYDFQFNFSDIKKLSCTELVFDCCKGFISEYGIEPKKHRFLLFSKTILSPDDFVSSSLTKVWRSKNLPKKAIRKLGL